MAPHCSQERGGFYGVSYRNAEGYSDPVPYAAARKMDQENRKYRPLVYICSPFQGDEDGNVAKARRFCRFAVDQGAIPLAPHLLFPQFMEERSERELALFMGMVLLGHCSEVWVFGERISSGMEAEIAKAEKKQMRIRYFTEDMREV